LRSHLQLIDFSAFLSSDALSRKSTAKAVLDGFQNAGFIYLKNHGISAATREKVFTHSAKFFARSKEEKDKLAWYSPKANRGYTAQGREKVTQLTDPEDVAKLREQIPDLKESIEIGREGEPGMPNMWPSTEGDEEAKEFKEIMIGFHNTCKELYIQIMRAIAQGMGIQESWFDGFTDGGDNTLRLLHYPEVPKSVFKRDDGQLQVRAGEHSDYGSFSKFNWKMIEMELLIRDRWVDPTFPRCGWWPPGQITKRYMGRCYTNPRYHSHQRWRSIRTLVKRHNQIDQASSGPAAVQARGC
jgi:isopenicillin N synthase-like dioxygenase